MKWEFVKPIHNFQMINLFEKIIAFEFPKGFKTIVKKYNGGCPQKNSFDTEKSVECEFNNLLSFNEGDEGSVWELINQDTKQKSKWDVDELDWQYIPFASDSFGNFICFDRSSKHIVFWDHEAGEVEEVAKNFDLFIDSLYEIDEEAILAKYLAKKPVRLPNGSWGVEN